MTFRIHDMVGGKMYFMELEIDGEVIETVFIRPCEFTKVYAAFKMKGNSSRKKWAIFFRVMSNLHVHNNPFLEKRKQKRMTIDLLLNDPISKVV